MADLVIPDCVVPRARDDVLSFRRECDRQDSAGMSNQDVNNSASELAQSGQGLCLEIVV
jgi:hypothetical protein